MTEMTDKSNESPDETTPSLRRYEKTNGSMKEPLGIMRSFRKNIQGAVGKSPFSSGGRGSKVTPNADRTGDETGSQPPPSPSLSIGSPTKSPVKHFVSFLQKKQEDEADVTHQRSRPIKRSKTDPNMSVSRDSFSRGSIKSLMKVKNKIKAAPADSMKKMEEEEEVLAEVEETYTLPEIPHTPLSVMQISKLIETEMLEEAHLNLLALRREFQLEREQCGEEDSPMELVKKEKDLNLLYEDLRNKISTTVCNSNSLPSSNKVLLLPLARIIQEEEKRAKEPGGLPGSWMEAWKEAVGKGVRVKVESLHLEQKEQKEQKASWLASHLGQLGRAIVEDLEKVKKELRWSYPPSFEVFSTYVQSYHRGVRQHLKKLELQVTELRELFLLLDWILNTYQSESIMGNPSLQPDMKAEDTELQLEENFLKLLKEKYCSRVKDDTRFLLNKIIEIENETFWETRKTPENEEDSQILSSHIHMDIWTNIEGKAQTSRRIDAQLEQKVVTSCLEELKQFPKRFEEEFNRHCSSLKPQPLWTQYQITYINTFTDLQQHMDEYQAACPDQVEGFGNEVRLLITRLLQDLEDRFKDKVEPYLSRMMTRKWLNNDDDFTQLFGQTERLSQHCALMRPPHSQELASRLHYHVVKEYIGQLMKNNYSCKNRRHEIAATKIQGQWNKLSAVFDGMASTHDWLFPVGDDLCKLIGQKNKADIKNHIEPLIKHYPDFSRVHLVAVLRFRGLVRGHERDLILQRFTVLKKKLGRGDKSQVLFGDMQVMANTSFLSNVSYHCFSFLWPNN